MRHILNLTDEQIDSMNEWDIKMLPRRYIQTKREIYGLMIFGRFSEETETKQMTSGEADKVIETFDKLSGGKRA